MSLKFTKRNKINLGKEKGYSHTTQFNTDLSNLIGIATWKQQSNCSTLSGPAYFKKKLNIQIFQLFENDSFLSNLLKSEYQKAFKV